MLKVGFLVMILLCSQSDDLPKTNLAKIGYLLDMKVEKKPKAFYILGYQVEFTIKKSGKFGSFFFQ
jgi:hypothetical protein